MNHDEHLDNLLDEALGEYRDAEPLAGFESRILARIAEREPCRSPLALRWALALATAAAIALAVWFGIARRTPETAVNHEVAATKQVEQAPAKTPATTSAEVAAKPRKAVRPPALASTPTETAAQAKPAVFPLPSSLTPEERAFLAALNQSASALPVASEPDKPITIADIEIKPLAIGGLPSSEDSGENQ